MTTAQILVTLLVAAPTGGLGWFFFRSLAATQAVNLDGAQAVSARRPEAAQPR
ncbi:hypothetical protein LL946_10490 [Knoellia locipacati]|uniref:hypothetical protein n=1 Tax=Knoellia locipacati TaxID=882824 RepID=UPI00384AEDDD